jgi:transaldolase
MPKKIEELRIKIFADGAEKASILELYQKPFIKGFTTNPTLMRKAGVTDYAGFAKEILEEVKTKPISFEVFSDDFTEMERQARIINSWADNVYVKIPITNTKKQSSFDLIKKLAAEGVKMNVTAILTPAQVEHIIPALSPDVPTIISVFAGRIADTGVDPVPVMRACKALLAPYPKYELLWASPRELYNIYEAEEVGAEIITVTPEVLKKAEKVGYDLEALSLDTVKMFYDDGQKVCYTLYE